MTDKNLFMYDLAVVAIMKNEAPYIKEWLDYHLLAGVNHFYIYDNDSTDNMKEILQPYIDKNIVTYIFYPGKARQYEAYDDAILNYRYFCRYMAFIDGDEFIFPQDNKSVVEVLDEVLLNRNKVAGLAVNWHQFGSNNLDKADYNRGVLERFTMRDSDENIPIEPLKKLPGGNALVKLIANPRRLDYFWNPHFAVTYPGLHVVNENGEPQDFHFNNPPTVSKIVINHYPHKSREEYLKKVLRGAADTVYNIYEDTQFQHIYNDVFDDGIIKYRDSRKKFKAENSKHMRERLFKAVKKNLFSHDLNNLPKDFFQNNLENFLVCLMISEKFKFQEGEKNFSGYSLFWIGKILRHYVSLEDSFLLLSTLPDILKLPYDIKESIRKTCIELLPMIIEYFRTNTIQENFVKDWDKIAQLKNILRLIESLDAYKK